MISHPREEAKTDIASQLGAQENIWSQIGESKRKWTGLYEENLHYLKSSSNAKVK